MKGCRQGKQENSPEGREAAMETPARRARSSHISSPLSRQRDRSKKTLESNDEHSSPTSNSSKISEHSKKSKSNPSSKSYIKAKHFESDEGNSKENCDPSLNPKQANKLQSQSEIKTTSCKTVEPKAEGSCSSFQEIEPVLKPTDSLRIGTEIEVHGFLDRQPLKQVHVADGKDNDSDYGEDDDVFESPGQVKRLRILAKQKTLGKTSSFKVNNKKKNHKASNSRDRDSTNNMETRENRTETCSFLERSLLPKVSKHKKGENGSNQSCRKSNKCMLPSVSIDKDQKLSRSRTSTAQKQNSSREIETSDETESIEVTTSDCSSHNSNQQDKNEISSTSTVTLPRGCNSSPATDNSEDAVPLDDDDDGNDKDKSTYPIRKRAAAGNRIQNTKRKSSASSKQSSRTKSVTNKNRKSVSVSDQHLHARQKTPQKPKKTRGRSCPEEVTPSKENVGSAVLPRKPRNDLSGNTNNSVSIKTK